MLISFLLKMTHLFIVDYYSKFAIRKKANSLTANDLVKAARILFKEYLPKKIISGVGINFTLDTSDNFADR